MGIIRKLLKVGTDSRAVTLPKSWITNAEQRAGKKVVAVALDVSDVVTISPVYGKPKTKGISSSNDNPVQRV